MKKKLAIKGCIVTLALLLLSSPSIAVAKDLSDLRYCNSNTSISFVKVILWHSFSFNPVPNDSAEEDKDI